MARAFVAREILAAPGDNVLLRRLLPRLELDEGAGRLTPFVVGLCYYGCGADRGQTALGPLRFPFVVEGLTLRYTGVLRGLEDRLEPDGSGFRGRSYLHGRELGRFELRRP